MNKLIQIWSTAAKDLDLDIITPFVLNLNELTLDATLLLKNFGAIHGMLVFKDYDLFSKHQEQIISAGYGFTVLSEPLESEKYSRNEFIEILNDWSWTGSKINKPIWLNDVDES